MVVGVFFIGRWSGTLVLLEGGWVVRYITRSDGQLFVHGKGGKGWWLTNQERWSANVNRGATMTDQTEFFNHTRSMELQGNSRIRSFNLFLPSRARRQRAIEPFTHSPVSKNTDFRKH